MLFIGLDIGTSGCRAIAVDSQAQIQGMASKSLPAAKKPNTVGIEQSADIWWQTSLEVLQDLLAKLDKPSVEAIAVDGTSASVLLIDTNGKPLTPALMYNDSRSIEQARLIEQTASNTTICATASSSLAKLLWLKQHTNFRINNGKVFKMLHQADWISGQLSGDFSQSDINNCLKLGYQVQTQSWPVWFDQLNIPPQWLPKVNQPGEVIGNISQSMQTELGLSANTKVIAGTTDSTASFLASGASEVGDAVTTLGSTMVLKVVSNQPIESSSYGIYSQPLFGKWLVGGASNVGGAVLSRYFSTDRLASMTDTLAKHDIKPTGLNYYPLTVKGERFPINDPNYQPILTPRPQEDHIFFQAILEGIAKVEKLGYDRLLELGAPYPLRVFTMGGGSVNNPWINIRMQQLGVPVSSAVINEAAFGTALLARRHTTVG